MCMCSRPAPNAKSGLATLHLLLTVGSERIRSLKSEECWLNAGQKLSQNGSNMNEGRNMKAPPAIRELVINDEILGFHLDDGRFISVPIDYYPTLPLCTP